ncbi:MAG: hypothetical protein ACN4GZ_06530 [Acidimicrobiales bacterium]
MNKDATLEQPQPSKVRSIVIFAVLVISSVSGAAVAQISAPNSVPDSIGQPDTEVLEIEVEPVPDPLAFREE